MGRHIPSVSGTIPQVELLKCIKRRTLDEYQLSELSASSLPKQCDDSLIFLVSCVPGHDRLTAFQTVSLTLL